jgi:hypothetical protein
LHQPAKNGLKTATEVSMHSHDPPLPTSTPSFYDVDNVLSNNGNSRTEGN